MYELIQLTTHDYYVDCPAKIGIVKTSEDGVVLIDSGSDKDAGKKVNRILEANGWKLQAILNTHSHADHIGGNRFLQEKTGCKIYAPGLELAYTLQPRLESMGLYGGLPFKDIQSKFLMAQQSDALPLTEAVLPAGMKLLPLPGHSFDMTGFLSADGTAYIADCVSSAETLGKYGLGYLWDPTKALETLEYIGTLETARFVPAHAPVTDHIDALADLNAAAIRKAQADILDICSKPLCFEDILQQLFQRYGMAMNAQQYVLIGSTLRSYLSSLYTEGRLHFFFADSRMLWTRGDEN